MAHGELPASTDAPRLHRIARPRRRHPRKPSEPPCKVSAQVTATLARRKKQQAKRGNEPTEARAERLAKQLQTKCDDEPTETRAERLAGKRDQSDAFYDDRTTEQREQDRLAKNQQTKDSYHRTKLKVVRKPTPTSTSGSQYSGVYKYKGGPDRWKAKYTLKSKGGRGDKRTSTTAQEGPFNTVVEAARAWDKLRSSAPGFKKPKLLNFPDEYEAAVAAGVGVAAPA